MSIYGSAPSNKRKKKKKQRESTQNRDVWLTWADAAEKTADNCDSIPPEGEDFAVSVKEKLLGIAGNIRKRGLASNAQISAIMNMQRGVNKWLHTDDRTEYS